MKLSVIIPQSCHDPRGRFDFIESWCRQTGVDPDEYEVVVAVNDRDESAVRACRRFVRPQDQVIAFHGENDQHYYTAAISASRGGMLLLTENHVVADEYCVASAIAFFERTRARCGFLRAKHINPSRFARHEGESYDRQVAAIFLRPDCWDRVHLRGFVIARDVLMSVGGLPWQYELFCAPLLAMRLLRASIPIEYCAEAVIHHVNISSRSFLRHEIRSYVENDFRYRDERHFDDDECILGTNEISERRRLWVDDLISVGASALTCAIWNQLTGRSARSAVRWRTLLATAARWQIAAALGPRLLLWTAHLKHLWRRIRYGILQFSASKGNFAFDDLWKAAAELEGARYCVAHPQPPVEPQATSFGEGIRNWIGFYGLENRNGHRFRWSEPAALLSFELDQDDYEICIDTGGIRGVNCCFRFDLFFNGRQIEPAAIDIEAGCIRFRVTADSCRNPSQQVLLILTQPVQSPHCPTRRLGMPVRSVSCRPVSVTIPRASQTGEDSHESGWKGFRQVG